MISRRALLVSALAAVSVRPPTARAQAVPASGSDATTAEATILRLQPRTIEVNGKLPRCSLSAGLTAQMAL